MYRKIVVPLDGSELAEEAIGRAASLAKSSSATLDLVLVHEPLLPGLADPTWNEKQIVREENYLRTIAAELQSGAGVTATVRVLSGPPVDQICNHVLDVNADLVVMTSQGRTGWSRAWIGSIADGVLRHLRVPVLMLHPMERAKDRRAVRRGLSKILVPLDGSSMAEEIFAPVADLALASDAQVTLFRVVLPVPIITADIGMPYVYLPNMVDDPATEQLVTLAHKDMAAAAAKLRKQGVSVVESTVVVSNTPGKAIAEFAKGPSIDAVAMTTHGRGASRLLVGSVADKVRRATQVPVLLYRPARVETPADLSPELVAEQLPALAGMGQP